MLPDDIGQLTNLTKLNLGKSSYDSAGNQLTALPDSICRFTSLTELDVSGNQLKVLADGRAWCGLRWIGEEVYGVACDG